MLEWKHGQQQPKAVREYTNRKDKTMADRNLAQLKEELAIAAAKGDMDAILSLAKEVGKLEASEKAARESEAQKRRAEVCTSISKAIRPVLEKFVGDVEVLGGVLRATWQPGNNDLLTVAIASTAPKAVSSATGNGDGKPGKLRGLYGLSLGEMFDKVATPEEQTAYAEKVGNSAQYAFKNRIVQAAISAGLFKPIA